MIILVDNPISKAWQAYDKASKERVYQFGGVVILLSVFLLLFMVSRNPRVGIYNGVDMWFWLLEQLPFGGILMLSLGIVLVLGDTAYKDLKGVKTIKEWREDEEKKKKDSKFQPKEKKPFQVNPYYAGGMVLEGIVWGSLIFALLPDVLLLLFKVFGDNAIIPKPFDALSSVWAYHTNVIQDIALAFGAGVYEELIFRSLFYMLLIHLGKNYGKKYKTLKPLEVKAEGVKPFPFIQIPKHDAKNNLYLRLLVIGALAYTISHVVLPFGDHLTTYGFVYRMFFGGIMYTIFVKRGPAMAMWTHTVYDLLYFGLRWWM